jgi:hypothetical protein
MYDGVISEGRSSLEFVQAVRDNIKLYNAISDISNRGIISTIFLGNRDNEIIAVDNHILCLKIQVTFANILSRAVLKVKIY